MSSLPDDILNRAQEFYDAHGEDAYIDVTQKGAVTRIGVGVKGKWRASCDWDHREYKFGPALRRQRWDKMIKDIEVHIESETGKKIPQVFPLAHEVGVGQTPT